MKRFITYLYSYNGKSKEKNVGFIKVEINGENSAFLVQIKNCGNFSGKGTVYLVYEKNIGVPIGEIIVKNGEARQIYEINATNVAESGKNLESVLGVRIQFEEKFLASCWTDDAESVVGQPLVLHALESQSRAPEQAIEKIIEKQQNGAPDNGNKQDNVGNTTDNRLDTRPDKDNMQMQKDIKDTSEKIPLQEQNGMQRDMQYTPDTVQRIENLSELRTLPTKNWYLVNNSFLTHGYANYRHLVIKTDANGRKHLGVPGVSEPPERMMANIFGFTDFEPAAPVSAADVDSGVFGYWFCPLEL